MMIALMAVAMTIMNEMIAVSIVLVVMHSLTTMEIMTMTMQMAMVKMMLKKAMYGESSLRE